ncbi:metalloprotease [Coemansia sp. RSA 1200]|nr:metalloprotease [Coemansia sp. RSA 1200]
MRTLQKKSRERFYLVSVVLAAVLAFLLVRNRTASNETLFAQRRTTESKSPYYEYTGLMEQSPNDHRQHRVIRLPNGISALCTYDPQAETAAASLAINVGSLLDPPSFQGMAHFLEHMLFMGSGKYPNEDDYTTYLANHSGSYNAATGKDHTHYYFSVDNDAFEGALDRLSWFFVNPLLKPNGVDREVHAVDSEFKGSLRNSNWRFFSLLSSLSAPEHPYSMFNCGNLETLKVAALQMNVSLADEVRKFYDTYYSASIMKLTVVGNHTLDQLTEWAVSKFSAVEDKGDTRIELNTHHPVGPNELGKAVFYENLDDSDEIVLQFPVPNTESEYRQPVHQYFSVLLNTDTSGSLFSYLKEKGWATDVDGANSDMVNSQLSTFYIQVELTPLGTSHYQEVVKTVFEYLQMLREVGPQAWFYNEFSQIMKLDYQFYERPSELHWAIRSSKVQFNDHLLPEHILSHGQIISNGNTADTEKRISDFLEYLNPSNYRLFFGSQKHKSVDLDKQTPFYNVSYHIEQLDSSLTAEQAVTEKGVFSFPKPNVFIPENLQMSNTGGKNIDSESSGSNTQRPQLLKLSDKLELWFKQDTQFHTPHGAVYITIEPKHLPSTPQESVHGSIYSMCMSSVLKKELYGVGTGGMHYSVGTGGLSLNIELSGFKEKMPLLLSKIMHRVTNFELTAEDYEMYRQELERSFSHVHFSTASESIKRWQAVLTHSPAYYYKEREYALLNNVTLENTREYVAGLLKQTFVQMMVSGQFTEAEALEMSDTVIHTVDSAHLEREQMHNVHAVNVSPGKYMYSFGMSDEGAANGGVVSTIYCGMGSDQKESATLMVIRPILHNQFFEELRTKEQLGYAVGAGLVVSKAGRSNFRFLVQGEHNPVYAKLRIDNFIRSFRSKLEELNDSDIQEKINALAKSILEKQKSISEDAAEDWGHIEGGWYDFDSKHKLVEQLRLVTKEDILGAWDRSVNPSTTAENYTRIDYYAWPQKMWSPQSEDLVEYPETILALHGCLKYDGIASGELADVAEAVALIQAGIELPEDNTDSLASRLYQLYNDSNSTLNSRTALEMALKKEDNIAELRDSTSSPESKEKYLKIGMDRTAEGVWMIHDIARFKTVNGVYPLPEPVERLAPKY